MSEEEQNKKMGMAVTSHPNVGGLMDEQQTAQ